MAKNKATTEEPEAIPAPGGIRKIRVRLKGKPPGLLMCSKAGMDPSGSGKVTTSHDPKEEAELAAYWTCKGKRRQLCIPWNNLYKCICAAAKRYRFKGREMMNTIVAATIACEAENVPLGTDQYRIDSRWGRIPPKTGGVVMLNRAHVPEWECEFVLLVDDEFYPADKLKDILAVGGKLVGVLANRPQLQGPYGRFDVTLWEMLE